MAKQKETQIAKKRVAHFKNHNASKLDKNAIIIIGVSILGQPRHQGKDMRALHKMLDNTFSGAETYLLGDTIQRYNLVMENGGKPENHFRSAVKFGETWLSEHQELVSSKIIKFSDKIKLENYQKNLTILQKYFNQDMDFKKAIHDFANNYLERRKKDKKFSLQISVEDARELCIEYALEELAIIFSCFKTDQKNYFIYPDRPFKAFELTAKKLAINDLEWLTVEIKNKAISKNELRETKSSSEEELSSSPENVQAIVVPKTKTHFEKLLEKTPNVIDQVKLMAHYDFYYEDARKKQSLLVSEQSSINFSTPEYNNYSNYYNQNGFFAKNNNNKNIFIQTHSSSQLISECPIKNNAM